MGGGGGGAEERQTDSHTETDSQPARQTFRQKQRDGESLMKSAFPVVVVFFFCDRACDLRKIRFCLRHQLSLVFSLLRKMVGYTSTPSRQSPSLPVLSGNHGNCGRWRWILE